MDHLNHHHSRSDIDLKDSTYHFNLNQQNSKHIVETNHSLQSTFEITRLWLKFRYQSSTICSNLAGYLLVANIMKQNLVEWQVIPCHRPAMWGRVFCT